MFVEGISQKQGLESRKHGGFGRYGDGLDVNANVEAVVGYLEDAHAQQAALLPALLPDSGLSCLVCLPPRSQLLSSCQQPG